MMRPTLTALPSRSDTVTLPRYRVVEAAMDAKALADDFDRALLATEQRMWAGNRAGAVNEISRAHLRVDEMRDAWIHRTRREPSHSQPPVHMRANAGRAARRERYMGLLERINHPDRRLTASDPTTERRSGDERRIPEWRRRALEQHDRLGFVAVTDLTKSAA